MGSSFLIQAQYIAAAQVLARRSFLAACLGLWGVSLEITFLLATLDKNKSAKY